MYTFKHSYKIIFFVLIFAIWAVPSQSFQEYSDAKNPLLKCGASCHLPENIAKAKQDRTQKKACMECHVNGTPSGGKSPFHPRPQFLLASNPNPSPKLAVKTKNKPPHENGAPPEIEGRVFIPKGEFIMGSNERWDDEAPEHISETSSFYIDLFEVTNEKYKKFATDTNKTPPHHWPEGNIPQGKEKHPVIYVSWFDARDYCAWEGKRLPTEAEWEKAARGEDGLIYPWGDIWSLDKSNNPYKYSTGTQPVGSYPEGRSPYGLFDMSGNVWEWVDSFYLPHPGNTVARPDYGTDKRLLKGGSWFDCLSYGCGLSAPTFNRSFFNPEVKNNSFGFRCAKDGPEVKTTASPTKE